MYLSDAAKLFMKTLFAVYYGEYSYVDKYEL